MEASRARLRGIRRVDSYNFDASAEAFIADKLPELPEGPGVVESALGLPQAPVGALTDTLQVLKSNRLLVSVGRLYNMLANLMIDPCLVTTFLARKPVEDSTRVLAGRLRARICLRLKRLASFMFLQPVSIQRLTTKRGTIGERSNVLDTQVNTQRASWLVRIWNGLLDLDVEVVLLAFLDQYRTGRLLATQGVTLVVSYFKGNLLSAIQQGQTNGPVLLEEPEDHLVVVDTGRLEDGVAGLGLAELGRYSGNRTDGQVGRQTKERTHVVITTLVEVILSAYLMFTTPLRYV
ncbi:hypothetical protein LCGC14_3008220, partial [marine sediment metagenome]